MLRELVLKNRSCRRFAESQPVEMPTLRELVDLARVTASGANLQPLKYMLFCDPADRARIFPHLAWAGYLGDWAGPEEGERPTAYVVVLCDTWISKTGGVDHGIAAQTIMLAAVEKGLGGCILGAIDREALREVLDVPSHCEILLVLALGTPIEEAQLEDVEESGSIEYWRDDARIHHVPKRRLDDVILSG